MQTNDQFAPARRALLQYGVLGFGSLALAHLDGRMARAEATSANTSVLGAGNHGLHGVLRDYHVRPKAKRVIFLYMAGGPSQFESLDNKPMLANRDGQPMPESYWHNQPIAQLQGQRLVCMGPRFPFRKVGQSGQEISTLFPHLARIADDICILRGMQTDQINHDPAHTVMNTGTSISGRPSMGSWITYGLGSVCSNLPGFVVLTSFGGRNPQPISTRHWHSGFLPGQYQGVELRSRGEPVYYSQSPAGVDEHRQRETVRAIQTLDTWRHETTKDPELLARVRQYETAFQMQRSVPGLMDLRDEFPATLERYGARGADGSYAANCLLARRLAERGVRFIQLYHRGWDHHNDLASFMTQCAGIVDQPTAALVRDLKERHLLEDTLIVWSGEFGRTPMAQSGKGIQLGRDHHIRAFSAWLAGGGIKGGVTFGETDELGYSVVRQPVHVHDLHATMLHLLGINHERLTYRQQGRDFRLTDVSGRVVREILV